MKSKTLNLLSLPALGVLVLTAFAALSIADDWPQWGRDASRNMISDAKNLPADFAPGEMIGRSEEVDMKTTENIKWIAKLGSQSYGNASVAGGYILLGTNNDAPRDPKYKGDRSAVYCLDEKTGEFKWQLNIPKLGAGKVSDWEFLGICSSPAIVGDRVYVITNLCEVVCLDLNGMTNGNDGVKDEVKYLKLPPGTELGEKDADIIWRFDMRELGSFPHNITSSSVLVHDGVVYASTSNGKDWSHVDTPNTQAPVLVALDAKTGELLAEEYSGISTRIMHCNWSSPALATIGGADQLIFGAGDGFIYGFATKPKMVKDEFGDEFPVLDELWRCDGNPKEYRFDADGKPIKYATAPGPSEFIATPVVYKGKIYASIGQDPEHGNGVGALTCFDPTKRGDSTKNGGIVWQNKEIQRSISTVSIVDDLVYAPDYAGKLYCFDANTGELYWSHDTYGHIWGSALVADGKVYLGNEDGYLTILKAGKKKEVINEIEFPAPIFASPIVANGVLYIATQSHLYAIEAK